MGSLLIWPIRPKNKCCKLKKEQKSRMNEKDIMVSENENKSHSFITVDVEGESVRKYEDLTMDKRVDVMDIFEGDNKPKWGLNEKNPDHLVGRVDSVNMGFVNRLDRRFGSLCVYMFYQKYLAILDAKRREIPFLHQIFEEIQEELQLEKKQPPECKWNDSTQYIVFKKNKKIAQ